MEFSGFSSPAVDETENSFMLLGTTTKCFPACLLAHAVTGFLDSFESFGNVPALTPSGNYPKHMKIPNALQAGKFHPVAVRVGAGVECVSRETSMGVVENLKDVADLVKKTGEIELYKKIVAAEDEVRELTRDRRRLEDEVEELRRALRFQEEIVFNAPFYVQREGDQTPYCPRCWEKDKHAVHVVLRFDHSDRTCWQCPACDKSFNIQKDGVRRHQVVPSRSTGWS